jgi:fibronectin type 3 domain-containing protein
MGNVSKRLLAIAVALTMVLTSGIGVFAASSPTLGTTGNVVTHFYPAEGIATVSYDPATAAVSYKIYVNGVLAATSTTTSATINIVDGQFYDIQVSAVDKNGKESALSAATSDTLSKRWNAKTTIKKLKGSKKKISVEWKKVSGATGYMIQVAKKDGSWQTVKTVGNKSKTTIKKLKKGKYEVRVRPVNGAFLGVYTGAKTVKVK